MFVTNSNTKICCWGKTVRKIDRKLHKFGFQQKCRSIRSKTKTNSKVSQTRDEKKASDVNKPGKIYKLCRMLTLDRGWEDGEQNESNGKIRNYNFFSSFSDCSLRFVFHELHAIIFSFIKSRCYSERWQKGQNFNLSCWMGSSWFSSF